MEGVNTNRWENGENLRRFGSGGDSGEQSLISSSASVSPLAIPGFCWVLSLSLAHPCLAPGGGWEQFRDLSLLTGDVGSPTRKSGGRYYTEPI